MTESATRNRSRLAAAAFAPVRRGSAAMSFGAMFFGVMLFGAMFFGAASTSAGAVAPQAPNLPGMVRVTIEVELSCPSCAVGLERRLGRLDHVAGVDVSPPDGQVVLAVEPGHYLDLAAVWDTVRNAGFLPDVLMVTAIGRVTEMNGAPALSLSPDFALPLVGEDGLTPLAIEAGDQTVQVTGRWDAPPDSAGRLQIESIEAR